MIRHNCRLNLYCKLNPYGRINSISTNMQVGLKERVLKKLRVGYWDIFPNGRADVDLSRLHDLARKVIT